jgi:K+-sensing histidine kinase KdpD
MNGNKDIHQHAPPPALLQRFFRGSSPSKYPWRFLGIPLTIIVALLDYYTGDELNITLLYLAPIALASWKLGKGEAVLVAAFSAIVWFVENYLLLHQAASLWIPFWNMVGQFGFFLTVVLILSSLRKAFTAQERLIGQLQDALGRVRTLSGLLPICSWCKKVRDDRGYWRAVEAYIEEHSQAEFTHGICPDCSAGMLTGGKPGGDRDI